tara:strand:+ start:850 stop:1221 length:372 start_codon:yes stop_codon:yes gene_type:complete
MRNILKFQRKTGDYKVKNYDKSWRTETGTHYLHYPFLIYKRKKHWVLTHLSSGAEICTTTGLKVAKYIATRLLPIPQFLLPNGDLVDYMPQETKRYCLDMIGRYRDVTIEEVKTLDKNCPFTI